MIQAVLILVATVGCFDMMVCVDCGWYWYWFDELSHPGDPILYTRAPILSAIDNQRNTLCIGQSWSCQSLSLQD